MNLPSEIHHYEEAGEVPSHILKYWKQRYEIFSKYDEGILMTDDAWFSVTPESVAIEIAKHVADATKDKTVLIDAFGGAGGNAIQFALSGRWTQIFMVEKNPEVLACAKHNAEVYGVSKKIFFIEGDIFKVLQSQLRSVAKKAVIFGSPPWGGPTYTTHDVFDLDSMEPYSISQICDAFLKHASHVVLFLPRTSNLRQLVQYSDPEQTIDVVHYCTYGYSKGLCVYYGSFS